MVAVKTFSQKVMEATGIELYNGQSLQNATQKIAGSLPSFLTGTANFVTNLLLMFFVLYYMLIHGRKMEKYLSNFIPLKEKNLEILSQETNLMIRANAIGIPLLAIIQGLVAMLGYFIFGIKDYGLWGFVTGVASLIPIVGNRFDMGATHCFFIGYQSYLTGYRPWHLFISDPYECGLCGANYYTPENRRCTSAHYHFWSDSRPEYVWLSGVGFRAVIDQLLYSAGKNLPQ